MSKLKVVYYNITKTAKKQTVKKYCFAPENSQQELSEIHEYSSTGNRARGLRRVQNARVKIGKSPYQYKTK